MKGMLHKEYDRKRREISKIANSYEEEREMVAKLQMEWTATRTTVGGGGPMSLKDYQERKREINKEASLKKLGLDMLFNATRVRHKIGDIVSDSKGYILIEEIKIDTGIIHGPAYIGLELNKNKTIKKRETRRCVFLKNVID